MEKSKDTSSPQKAKNRCWFLEGGAVVSKDWPAVISLSMPQVILSFLQSCSARSKAVIDWPCLPSERSGEVVLSTCGCALLQQQHRELDKELRRKDTTSPVGNTRAETTRAYVFPGWQLFSVENMEFSYMISSIMWGLSMSMACRISSSGTQRDSQLTSN